MNSFPTPISQVWSRCDSGWAGPGLMKAGTPQHCYPCPPSPGHSQVGRAHAMGDSPMVLALPGISHRSSGLHTTSSPATDHRPQFHPRTSSPLAWMSGTQPAPALAAAEQPSLHGGGTLSSPGTKPTHRQGIGTVGAHSSSSTTHGSARPTRGFPLVPEEPPAPVRG